MAVHHHAQTAEARALTKAHRVVWRRAQVSQQHAIPHDPAVELYRTGTGTCIQVGQSTETHLFPFSVQRCGRCSRARAPLGNTGRADTFNCVAETGPRRANVTGEARLGLADFLPEV